MAWRFQVSSKGNGKVEKILLKWAKKLILMAGKQMLIIYENNRVQNDDKIFEPLM